MSDLLVDWIDREHKYIESIDPDTGAITWIGTPPAFALIVQRKVIRELRRKNYPPFEDMIEAFVARELGDNTLIQAYLAARQAVNQKYPMP